MEQIATLPYGSGPGQAGLAGGFDRERQGPQSFAVDEQGNFYISDTVNRRIQVISPQGRVIREIPTDGSPEDVAVDEGGNIVVLRGDAPILSRYDRQGKPGGSVMLPRAVYDARSSLDRRRRGICLLRRDQGEHLVLPAVGDGKSASESPGKIAEKQRPDYAVTRISEDVGEILVSMNGGTPSERIEIHVPGLASLAFLGEDEQGHLYIQVEQRKTAGKGVSISVLKVTAAGAVVDAVRDIPNAYSSWTTRLLQVDGRGNLYQMLPTANGVELRKWTW